MDSGKLRNNLDLIDISYVASEGVPGESRKRQLKKVLVSSIKVHGILCCKLTYVTYRAAIGGIGEIISRGYFMGRSVDRPEIKRLTDKCHKRYT